MTVNYTIALSSFQEKNLHFAVASLQLIVIDNSTIKKKKEKTKKNIKNSIPSKYISGHFDEN